MTEMKIITIEEHLAGAPINVHLAKYSFKDAPLLSSPSKSQVLPARMAASIVTETKELIAYRSAERLFSFE